MSNSVHKCSTGLKNSISWCIDKKENYVFLLFFIFFLDLSQCSIYGTFTDNFSASKCSIKSFEFP